MRESGVKSLYHVYVCMYKTKLSLQKKKQNIAVSGTKKKQVIPLMVLTMTPRDRNLWGAREHCSPESFCASGKLLRGNFFCPFIFKSLQSIWKVSGLSGELPDYLERF